MTSHHPQLSVAVPSVYFELDATHHTSIAAVVAVVAVIVIVIVTRAMVKPIV
jgi:hypothetical protein